MFNRRARETFEGTGEELDPEACADHYGLYTAEGDRCCAPRRSRSSAPAGESKSATSSYASRGAARAG